MTTTTFQNVGGTRQPAEQPAPAPKKPRAKAAAKPAKAAKPTVDEPKVGPIMIVIDGAGTTPLMDNNGRRVMRGEPVEVSQEEHDWLARSNYGFERL